MVTYSELLSVAENVYMRDVRGRVSAVKLKDITNPKVNVEAEVYSDELKEMTMNEVMKKYHAKNILYIQRTV